MLFYTYVYRDPSRDMEPFYVGKGSHKRAYDHTKRKDRHPMTHRIQLMKKTGIEPDIEIIPAINEDHAFFIEACLIKVMGRKDLGLGSLLNMTDGGDGVSGHIRTTEWRAMISSVHKGKIRSDETRTRMSKAFKGRIYSAETRAKMSAAAKNRTAEHKEKLARVNIGRKASPETRAKLSAAQKGRRSLPKQMEN